MQQELATCKAEVALTNLLDTPVSVIRSIVVKERSVLFDNRQMERASDAIKLAHELFDDASREYIVVCCLDIQNRPLSLELVGIGTANACFFGMREVFRGAILNNAVNIIVFHNHPSGNPEPSSADIEVTQNLRKAGEILNIKVLDHIIIGDDDYYSAAEYEGWYSGKYGVSA